MSKHARVNPLVRLLPSVTDFAFLMPAGMLFLVLKGAGTLLGDGDTGWHVRTGEWILRNGRVPDVDLFSFTRPGQPWFAWEWGWDVLFGWLHLNWGLPAVVAGSLLILCLTFALLYRSCAQASGNAFAAVAVTFTAVAASSVHWLARPHLFTLLFTVVFHHILVRGRDERRCLLLLPALTVIWTNLHGGFFTGIVLAGCFAAGKWIEAYLDCDTAERRRHLTDGQFYAAAACACLLASFANPYGYKLHEHIVRYLAEPYHREHISEFMSTSFQPSLARFFEVLLALGALTAAWKLSRRCIAPALLILLWAHLALIAGRNIPIFAIVAAPYIAEYLHHIWAALINSELPVLIRRQAAGLMRTAQEFGALDRIGRTHLTSGLAFACLTAAMMSPGATGKLRSDFDPARYPKAALAALAGTDTGRIFADDEWGDYIAWAWFPHKQVFIDGRSDFYGPSFGTTYLSVLEGRHDWQHTLDSWGISTVLLPVSSPLTSTLKESRRWRVTYDDGVAVVFRPASFPAGNRDRVTAELNHRGVTTTQPK